ncbi:MAG: alpha/beta hydrolase, partial [Acinetobacter sp.]
DDKNTNAPLVIFVHGFKGFKDWGAHHLTARYFAQNGFRYLKFNLSHSGVTLEKPNDVSDMETFATNTFSKEMLDVDLVINYAIANLGVKDVFLIGHSRGGGLSILQAASNANVKGLITWSSIADFSSLWKKEQETEWKSEGTIHVVNARTKEQMPLNVSLLEDFEANKEKLDILTAAKQITISWLIVQGDDDVNVPFETAQNLANANPNSRLVKIEGANHVYGASHPYNKETLPAQLLQVCEKSLMFLNEILVR